MYIVTSPDSTFNGEFTGYKFKNGNCITKLDENLKLWFKMLGFKRPEYAHIAPITIKDLETGAIRKLSKRK